MSDTSPFRIHTLIGKYGDVRDQIEVLLVRVNSEWRRRQVFVTALAALSADGGGVALFDEQYLVGLCLLIGCGIIASVGLSGGQHLEIEVETLTLCLALLAETKGNDHDAPLNLLIDMRSSVHATRHAEGRSGAHVVDQWFELCLPQADGTGLRLELTEHMNSDPERTQLGKRVGRDYHVALFDGHCFREEDLKEAVTSHVSAPSGTNIPDRVREGLDAFGAAIRQLQSSYAELEMEATRVVVERTGESDTTVNPRKSEAQRPS